MNEILDAKTGLKEALPTVFGYIGIGIAFGVIGHASGFSTLMVVLMSVIIYAGSAQFTTVSMLAAANPIASIVLATFLVNSRMILMSTTIAPFFKKDSTVNITVGTLLTDESFALGMNKLNYTKSKLSFSWFNAVNLVAYLTWIFATLIGAGLGNFVSDPKQLGLDFAIVAMFMGLLYLQVISDHSLKLTLQLTVVALTIVLTFISMIILPKNLVIIVVTLVGCGLGVVLKNAFFK